MSLSNTWLSGTSTSGTDFNIASINIGAGTYSSGSTIAMSSYGSTWTDSYLDTPDFSDKVLDIEKLSSYTEEKRKMIFDIFMKYIECTLQQEKTLLYNTLEHYHIIVDKKVLSRKTKISSLFPDKKEDNK